VLTQLIGPSGSTSLSIVAHSLTAMIGLHKTRLGATTAAVGQRVLRRRRRRDSHIDRLSSRANNCLQPRRRRRREFRVDSMDSLTGCYGQAWIRPWEETHIATRHVIEAYAVPFVTVDYILQYTRTLAQHSKGVYTMIHVRRTCTAYMCAVSNMLKTTRMFGVHSHRTCTAYMYHSINTPSMFSVAVAVAQVFPTFLLVTPAGLVRRLTSVSQARAFTVFLCLSTQSSFFC